MSFPRLRFEQAGATPEEIAALEERFDALPPGGQASQLAQLAGISNYDLAQGIAAARQPQAEVAEPEPEPEPEPDPPSKPGNGAPKPADAPPGE
jgi:hypothetical protein